MRRIEMDSAIRRVRDVRLALAGLLVLSMTANLALTASFAGRETVTVLVPAVSGPALEVGGSGVGIGPAGTRYLEDMARTVAVTLLTLTPENVGHVRLAAARMSHASARGAVGAWVEAEAARMAGRDMASAFYPTEIEADHQNRAVLLDDGKGGSVAWKPAEIGGRRGGSEVYRAEAIELRAGDRIRWTRNDDGLGLVNSRTAAVAEVKDGRVTFLLEDGRKLELGAGAPQLRHLDHAWASTVHAFQGRTVDRVIAAMEARHPHLTTQKSFYVEISRARDRAELVTDDAKELRTQLEAATGERIAALEGIGEMPREARESAMETPQTGAGKAPEPPAPEREKSAGMDLGL